MALKKIVLNNFRGRAEMEIPLEKTNILRGPNGAGKTTLKEAIVFVFTGSDSYGSKNPQHLISDGQPDTKVTIFTDKAAISRTLTRKGNGTIKVTRDDVPTTYTQAQLEELVGSAELFLSAFVPGYFLSLPFEKQNKVLAEVTPALDKHSLLKEHFNVEIPTEDKMRYNLNRRYDLVAAQVASDRRELEKEIARLNGESQGLLNVPKVDKPVEPPEMADLTAIEALRKQWSDYERLVEVYNRDFPRVARVKDENKIRASRRDEIKRELAVLKLSDNVNMPADPEELVELKKQIKPVPGMPVNAKIVESDHCPSCGQAVKIAHREAMKKKNEQAKLDYEAEMRAVLDHNDSVKQKIASIESQLEKMRDAVRATIAENSKITSKRHALELELARLVDQEVPVVGEAPTPPSEKYDEARYQVAKQKVDAYRKQLNEHEFTERQLSKNQERIKEIEVKCTNYKARVEVLAKIESALNGMTQLEMNLKADVFKMQHVRFEVSEEINVFYRDVPYILCSTGQRMKTDLEICLKFNSLMKRPVNAIFVDNADLVDQIDIPDGVQTFIAEVAPTLKQLEVSYG